ncbi:GIY-YIG nuclease family protein [Pedobacter sp. SD-b]|uniref:GIY-YIG nuclease family protein n=1 Tax=Pedobacter segetis TaxID=2793069 RepID=A0ABS1BI86_9SPHI|nr:exonuclease domain-containing protein [Pedobacter segetis]MBK0382560.1 GIY-YIG nuclease family protein [Pedobacter segetis]
MDNLYAIVDIETTGGHASAHGITEIAIYIHNGNEIVDEYQTLINPFQEIPVFIQSLTGISNEMVSKAPSFEEVAPKIFELLDQKIFVAHNVNFDYSFVNHHLKKEGFTLGNKKLCTVRLARKIFPGLPSYSLGKLSRSLNISIKNRHRAAGDAFATASIFKMMVDADDKGYITEALKAKAKEEALPPFISRSQIESIPRQPGVYYFKDKKDKIIYVGKAKNLYRRILSHFSNNSPNRNKQDFLREIRKISHQVCGTELQAMILENIEIKRLWPANNRAAKRPERRYCLYVYEDQKGFLRFGVGKKIKNIKPTYLFSSLAQSYTLVNNWCQQYGLCPKLCNIQKSTEVCSHLENGSCYCNDEAGYLSYNEKVNTLITDLRKELPSFMIVDSGRNTLEKSCILIEKGVFYGMGYLREHEVPNSLEKAKSVLQPYPSYQFIEKLIFDFALQHPHRQILLN